MGPAGQWVEVQIRSARMDEIAERGLAAHWKYKTSKNFSPPDKISEEDSQLDKWLHEIKTILEDPDPQGIDMLDTLKMNLFSSEIFVFTPKGDIKMLPQHATVLDFAFSLHSDMGYHCIGAKVNHALVPISHKLQGGDQVEILTSKSQNPTEEWFTLVTTAVAHTKIKEFLRRKKRTLIRNGQQRTSQFIESLQKLNVNITDDRLVHFFNYPNKEDFFYEVGRGNIFLNDDSKKLFVEHTGNFLKRYLWPFGSKTPPPPTPSPEANPVQTPNDDPELLVVDKKKPFLLDENAHNKTFFIARCCNPIPDDDTVGYLENNRKMIVHQRSCPVAIRLKSTYGERIFSVDWRMPQSYFTAYIEIKGIDSMGILNKITQVILNMSINIQQINTETSENIFDGKLKILVHKASDVDELCHNLSKVKGIELAIRTLE
jgi:GTP pyrophosphokinase